MADYDGDWYDKDKIATKGSSVLAKFNQQRAQEREIKANRERASQRPRIIVKRSYEGAAVDRLNQSWNVTNLTADLELIRALEILRNRARDLSVNNELARKYLQMCVTNIVGPQGFILQSQARDGTVVDSIARGLIEAAFNQWADRGVCEITGKHSFQDLQRLLVEAWKRDGEFLVRKIRGSAAGNPFGYALQVLEIDRLATWHNLLDTGNGTRIVMGVEIDLITSKPVAYWLRLGVITTAIAGVKITRVLADEIIHAFRPERPEQNRGVPPMHPVMNAMKMLAGYQEAAIVAARTGAAKMGFFTSPDGQAEGLATGKAGGSDGQGGMEGDFYSDAAPGEFGVLPPGYQFQAWNPDYPMANYDSFIKQIKRDIASGLGVCYNGLANDLDGVSFSSIRAAVIEERDNWMVDQDFFIEALARPVFNDWIEMALTSQAIKFPNGSALPLSKLQKFAEHKWQGRRWQWVDPLKDLNANTGAIRAGLTSPQRVAAAMGMDLTDVIEEIRAANEMAKSAGMPEYTAANPLEAPPLTPPDPAKE